MRFSQSLMFSDASQWVELARHAEDAGFHQIALSDHVFYPAELGSKYPYTPDGTPLFRPETPWPDVWVMVGAMASVTSRIEFTTNVYVLPARNPFIVAKAVGTAAFLTGDRVSLGVGAGWMQEEFDILEQPFAGRGARMDEQIEVLRTLWQGGMVEHHGEHYDFDKLEMSPAPGKPVPILIGGHSDRALKRAARIGDGWIGVHYTRDELKHYVGRLQAFRQEFGTADKSFEIVGSITDVAPTPDVCAELEAVGVDTLITSAWMMEGRSFASLDDNKQSLERFAAKYIDPSS